MARVRSQQPKASSPKTMPTAEVTGRAPVSEEHIRQHAYQLFESRQQRGLAGDAIGDWLQAERELRSKGTAAPRKRTTARQT